MTLSNPVKLALIGTGNRARTIYRPLFDALRPWVQLVAVCDPVREHAEAYAESMGVPAFTSIYDLVRARPMEAALVVAPVETHHPLSCYLSQHGIHNLVETSMTRMLVLGQEMVDTARKNGVVMRIAENFYRYPFDRIAKKVMATGFLGEVKRLTCFHDHTGYHNNSRWVVLYGAHPVAVQAIEHTMPTAPHYEAPHRYHEDESFRARFYTFPQDRLVVDMAGNIKSLLGRYPRPGYTEIDGQRGTVVQWPAEQGRGRVVQWPTEQGGAVAEVRYCSDEALLHGARADQFYPIVHTAENGCWASTHVDLPSGRVEYVNPYRPGPERKSRDFYGAAVMGHVAEFACAVRGAPSPDEGVNTVYSAEDALMALSMEVGARESALRGGVRLDLPLRGELEIERRTRQEHRERLGVDPLDIEGMLALSLPRP